MTPVNVSVPLDLHLEKSRQVFLTRAQLQQMAPFTAGGSREGARLGDVDSDVPAYVGLGLVARPDEREGQRQDCEHLDPSPVVLRILPTNGLAN